MGKPTIRQLRDAAPVSKAWASLILSEDENAAPPSRALAVHIYRQTGWKPLVLAELSEEEIDAVEKAEIAAGALPLKKATAA
jgi:hypothetical protein